jgi:hypothetical protein
VSISDYARRVRVHWELLTFSAPILYDRINPKLQEGYQSKSPTERVILNRKTDEAFATYIMVIGADHVRFGGMIERLEHAYSVRQSTMPSFIWNGPMTVTKNCSLPNPHLRTQVLLPRPRYRKRTQTDEAMELSCTTIPTCNVCGKKGHRTAVCFQENAFLKKIGTLTNKSNSRKKLHRQSMTASPRHQYFMICKSCRTLQAWYDCSVSQSSLFGLIGSPQACVGSYVSYTEIHKR